MHGQLIPEVDVTGNETGARICVACANLDCWHRPAELCAVDECDCQRGTDDADAVQHGWCTCQYSALEEVKPAQFTGPQTAAPSRTAQNGRSSDVTGPAEGSSARRRSSPSFGWIRDSSTSSTSGRPGGGGS